MSVSPISLHVTKNGDVDPSIFHNPHRELVIITGQQDHAHHQMK